MKQTPADFPISSLGLGFDSLHGDSKLFFASKLPERRHTINKAAICQVRAR
jgi:hypothetical protein